MNELELLTLLKYAGIAGIVLLVILFFVAGYVKASPDIAVIISGLKKTPRVLIGRAGFKIPFLEKVDHLHLGQISVDIKTDSYIPTNDFINVKVDAIAKIRVDTSPEGMLKAERNFLNKKPEMIAMDLQDSLQGNMREIIGTLDLKTINTDRDSFSDQVMAKASKDMEKLGIEILSCNIQNVTDENGLINDLGMDNTSKIKKDAAIAKAEADRDVAIAKAEADKAANDARVAAATEIAQKNTELSIKQSELKSRADVAKAEADAAYEIQNQQQQKVIQTETVNAQIAKAERQAELRQKEVTVREQELAAAVMKKADAEKYAVEKAAEAALVKQQREADALQYAAERNAAAIRAKYEAEAAGI
ncbi:MAG: flotillin family protein, partial [Erysipelotrichales bacterium]|nr:flotillin family protein [Erysipelotrichales bacterium]